MSIIQTYDSKFFNFLAPEEYDFSIETIAHALSNLCRFTGHCKEFYSVAQHSYLVSLYVPPPFQLEALLHDASEAFLGDVSTPLKRLLPGYAGLEFLVQKEIFSHFGIFSPSDVVKEVDLILLATEKRDLFKEDLFWPELSNKTPLQTKIVPWSPSTAKDTFIKHFYQLTQPKDMRTTK